MNDTHNQCIDNPSLRHLTRGISLPEVMVGVFIIAVAIMAFMSVFTNVSKVVIMTKQQTIAANLAQERMENLKQQSYYRLLTTVNSTTDSSFTPAVTYDIGYYPPETLEVADLTFERRVHIAKVQESSGDLVPVTWSSRDTGLKRVTVYVIWEQFGKQKKYELRNVRENPERTSLGASIAGTVTSGGAPVSDVMVRCIENASFNDTTDASGAYSFEVEPGTYTIRASKHAYFMEDKELTFSKGENKTGINYALTAMGFGTIACPQLWLTDHVVISQVVCSSVTVDGFDQEYVELYNMMSSPQTIASDSVTPVIDVYFQKQNGPKTRFSLTYNTLSIPASGYYLIANTDTVHVCGVAVVADAVYDATMDLDTIKGPHDGGVGIAPAATYNWIDRIAWEWNNVNVSDMAEQNPIAQWIGFEVDEQYVRKSDTGGPQTTYGMCYDSNNNNADFVGRQPLQYQPHNSATIQPFLTGTPAIGAICNADDELSSVGTATGAGSPPTASFSIPSVATGTWNVIITSGSYMIEVSTVTVTNGATTSLGTLYISTPTTYGYVSGTVRTGVGAPLPTIIVQSNAGGSDTSDAFGRYSLATGTGTVSITANPLNTDPGYVSAQSDIFVTLGSVTSGIDFSLDAGGIAYGFASTNGVDPLPGVPVIAKQGSVTMGNAVSDDLGIFTVRDLAVGTYDFVPYVEAQESCSPVSFPKAVAAGTSVFVTTFTISNAYGILSGTLSAGGDPIKTGVLIVASTSTISGAMPPTLNAAARAAGPIYYCASSGSTGTYSLSLPGGFTYNVYGWYSTFSGSTLSFPKQSGSAALSAGGNATVNLSW